MKRYKTIYVMGRLKEEGILQYVLVEDPSDVDDSFVFISKRTFDLEYQKRLGEWGNLPWYKRIFRFPPSK